MGTVNCLYCGNALNDDVAVCPHCGGVSHFQKRGYRHGARARFILMFTIVAIVTLLLALWLPR